MSPRYLPPPLPFHYYQVCCLQSPLPEIHQGLDLNQLRGQLGGNVSIRLVSPPACVALLLISYQSLAPLTIHLFLAYELHQFYQETLSDCFLAWALTFCPVHQNRCPPSPWRFSNSPPPPPTCRRRNVSTLSSCQGKFYQPPFLALSLTFKRGKVTNLIAKNSRSFSCHIFFGVRLLCAKGTKPIYLALYLLLVARSSHPDRPTISPCTCVWPFPFCVSELVSRIQSQVFDAYNPT